MMMPRGSAALLTKAKISTTCRNTGVETDGKNKNHRDRAREAMLGSTALMSAFWRLATSRITMHYVLAFILSYLPK